MSSAGQANFEAYARDLNNTAYDGTEIPPWDKLKPEIKAGWEAGARAAQSYQGTVGMEPTPNMEVYAEMVALYQKMTQMRADNGPGTGRFFSRAHAHLEDAVGYMRTFVLTLEEVEASPRPF
jgi:hypothetical protein